MANIKKVKRDTPTVLPAGMRIGDNSGLFILEFLDMDENNEYTVLSSTALTDVLKKDLYEKLGTSLKVKK